MQKGLRQTTTKSAKKYTSMLRYSGWRKQFEPSHAAGTIACPFVIRRLNNDQTLDRIYAQTAIFCHVGIRPFAVAWLRMLRIQILRRTRLRFGRLSYLYLLVHLWFELFRFWRNPVRTCSLSKYCKYFSMIHPLWFTFYCRNTYNRPAQLSCLITDCSRTTDHILLPKVCLLCDFWKLNLTNMFYFSSFIGWQAITVDSKKTYGKIILIQDLFIVSKRVHFYSPQ